MSRTMHHGKNHGFPKLGNGHRKRGPGWEYWGREAPMGCSKSRFSRERRIRRKAKDQEIIKEVE